MKLYLEFPGDYFTPFRALDAIREHLGCRDNYMSLLDTPSVIVSLLDSALEQGNHD